MMAREEHSSGIQFYKKLNSSIRDAGSAAAFAHQNSLNVRHVYEAHNGQAVHESVVRALGFVRVERFPVMTFAGGFVSRRAVYEKLNSFIRECGTQRAAAVHFGLTEGALGNICNARRGLMPVLTKLGFGLPVTMFLPLPHAEKGSADS
ncbi:MAG: hypothetical protein GX413_11175 [Acetobacter sp.]|nr:hypothetical protein [Acetobacter sp.]